MVLRAASSAGGRRAEARNRQVRATARDRRTPTHKLSLAIARPQCSPPPPRALRGPAAAKPGGDKPGGDAKAKCGELAQAAFVCLDAASENRAHSVPGREAPRHPHLRVVPPAAPLTAGLGDPRYPQSTRSPTPPPSAAAAAAAASRRHTCSSSSAAGGAPPPSAPPPHSCEPAGAALALLPGEVAAPRVEAVLPPRLADARRKVGPRALGVDLRRRVVDKRRQRVGGPWMASYAANASRYAAIASSIVASSASAPPPPAEAPLRRLLLARRHGRRRLLRHATGRRGERIERPQTPPAPPPPARLPPRRAAAPAARAATAAAAASLLPTPSRPPRRRGTRAPRGR